MVKMTDNDSASSTSSMPILSRYKQYKIKTALIASRTWIVRYLNTSVYCMICRGSPRVSRTLISGTYLAQIRNPPDEIAICNKCLSRINLRRELEQPWMERKLYGIKGAVVEHG
jgi:hypothetical protein